MKTINRILTAALFAASSALAANAAGDCQLSISYAPVSQGENVPKAIDSRLEAKVTRLLAQSGISSTDPTSRFFVAGRFDHAFADVTSGPSAKNMINTELTLYIGDSQDKKVFASAVFNLKGVGDTKERAFSKCLNGLSGSNQELLKFITEGRQKIVDYYDAQYPTILNQARAAMTARNYDEALYYATSIPECCKGFNQAQALSMEIYQHYTDYEGAQLLEKARGAWAASPDAAGAEEAFKYLSQIDPAAACAGQARELGNRITATTKSQWEFENVTKYRDAQALEKQRIEAARSVAEAWAKNQPKVIYNYTWLW